MCHYYLSNIPVTPKSPLAGVVPNPRAGPEENDAFPPNAGFAVAVVPNGAPLLADVLLPPTDGAVNVISTERK